jgi:hypothetical protein
VSAVDPAGLPRRRGSDVVQVEALTAWDVLRRYIVVGSWFGHALFLAWGVFFGISYGILGGYEFFTDMYLVDRIGALAGLVGIIMGVFIGVVCVWTICVILAAGIGAGVYWVRFRSFPMPPR